MAEEKAQAQTQQKQEAPPKDTMLPDLPDSSLPVAMSPEEQAKAEEAVAKAEEAEAKKAKDEGEGPYGHMMRGSDRISK